MVQQLHMILKKTHKESEKRILYVDAIDKITNHFQETWPSLASFKT